jgi:glycosyltransferase involved in cell wall biosynthesis
MKINISIIIPTLNRPNQIQSLVGRINDCIQDSEEVIFIDDSNVRIEEEISEIASFSFRYLHRGEKLGVSSARNEGARLASGDYLIFFDDDDQFSSSWLSDYRDRISSKFDLVYCDMVLVKTDGSKTLVKNENQKRAIVIPGAWMIKKSLFIDSGGFDERLKFGENTELFFRLDKLDPKEAFIPSYNFIYYQSLDGGSKNLQNMVDSNLLVLEKHGDQLSNHVKHLYHQVIGVNFLRFRKFNEAQFHLWEAYKLKPTKATTLLRFFISMFPWVSIMVYSKEVKIK